MDEFFAQYFDLGKKCRGQSIAEYAFILALVSVTAMAVLRTFGH